MRAARGAGHPDSGSSGSSGSSSPEPQEGTTSSASVSFVLYSLAHGFPSPQSHSVLILGTDSTDSTEVTTPEDPFPADLDLGTWHL